MKYEVVMSLRPKWAAAILAGTKTLEVRTSGPDRREMKQSGPITVWIYETKTDGGRGMVVGKFLCREVCRERIPPRDARRAEEAGRGCACGKLSSRRRLSPSRSRGPESIARR